MPNLIELAALVGQRLKERGLMLATAESCTGGGVAQAITEIAGSSEWFECGFVTYSNEAKIAMLKVPEEVLARHGAPALLPAPSTWRSWLRSNKSRSRIQTIPMNRQFQ